MTSRRRFVEIVFFLSVMAVTFYIIFHGQDMAVVTAAIKNMSRGAIVLGVLLALLFVSLEGWMIHYLLNSLGGRSGLLRCVVYSFLGFFYSGITPSATGGQPVQLYYMKKDGNQLSDSSVVLMVVAIVYKFVLVIMGALLLIFWHDGLSFYLGRYMLLYVFGLLLNVILVVLLTAVMLMPDIMKRLILGCIRLISRLRFVKLPKDRDRRVEDFVDGYRGAVDFLRGHKIKILVVFIVTFMQRLSIFLITYVVYRGFGLAGADIFSVTVLQASVYIAVDMLPLPGAQGITEVMYRSVFAGVFPGVYLMTSLYVTRAINFYFLLVFSAMIVIANRLKRR